MVLHGTKGGRPRSVSLLDQASKDRAIAAVREAIRVTEMQDGKLIPSSTLEGANRAYQRAMNAAGFKGSEASHALRYAFAREQFAKYLEDLGDKKRPCLPCPWTLATAMAGDGIASRFTCVRWA